MIPAINPLCILKAFDEMPNLRAKRSRYETDPIMKDARVYYDPGYRLLCSPEWRQQGGIPQDQQFLKPRAGEKELRSVLKEKRG